MATDATGTPTSLGIPKYNPNTDAPSGLGFNAAMDVVDGLLQDRVTPATTRILANKLLSSDAQPAFRIMGDGDLEWGAGGASAPDVNLYRSAANVLRTDDQIQAGNGVRATGGHLEASTGNLYLYGAAAGVIFGGSSDVNLYRSAADTLKTNDALHADGGFHFTPATGAGTALRVLVSGEANPRFTADVSGNLSWGAGGASAPDVNLYRSAANALNTDDAFTAALNITSAADIIARSGAGAQVKMGLFGPAAEAGIVFGSAADVNLYRSAADTLKTDDHLDVARPLTTDIAISARVGSELNARIRVSANGVIDFGPGGGTAPDVNLYRSAANILKTDDTFESAGGLKATGGHLEATTGNLYLYGAAAGVIFGGSSDVNLYRGGADILKTDDYFTVNNVAAPANATGIAVYIGGIGLRDIYVDAADTAGTGYRQLRVLN